MDLNAVLELIVKYGLGPVVLVVAVWYLNRQNEKTNARADLERAAFRDERDKRITTCEQHILECNQDRARLRQEFSEERKQMRTEIDTLQNEVRSLLKTRFHNERRHD